MTPGLVTRIQDIPGVEAVAIDLVNEPGGLNIRISPHADEALVLDRVHALLVTYGAKGLTRPRVRVGKTRNDSFDLGVDISITKLGTGARIQVSGGAIQSARQVASNPKAIAQGLADAWCQVLGRIPQEIESVSLADDGKISVTVSDGHSRRVGSANVAGGWTQAIATAVGSALGFFEAEEVGQTKLAPTAW